MFMMSTLMSENLIDSLQTPWNFKTNLAYQERRPKILITTFTVLTLC